MLLKVARNGLEARRHRLEPDERGVEVASEERKERVTDRVDPRGMAFPSANDIGLEDLPADVVDLEVPIEPHGRAHGGRIESLDGDEVPPIGLQLAEHVVAGGVCQLIVEMVDPEVGGRHGIGLDHTPESGLDEIVEWRIGRTTVRRFGRPGQGHIGESVAIHQSTASAAGRAWWPNVVSTSEARMISIVRSISARPTPRCVAARIC